MESLFKNIREARRRDLAQRRNTDLRRPEARRTLVPDLKLMQLAWVKLRSFGKRGMTMIHLSVRLAWHDNGWDGRICRAPHLNTACVLHDHIRDTRDDVKEKVTGRPVRRRFEGVATAV